MIRIVGDIIQLKDSNTNYQPSITTSKFNSIGTTTVITDWKTGRGVHCMSQGEALWFYILRWDDDNVEIREQYPLDMEEFNKIIDKLGIKRIRNPKFIMSTDFLVTGKDGKITAYSVKNDRQLDERTLQLLCAEKLYWISQNIKFKLLFKEDANKILANNIRLIVEYYHPESVIDEISKIKHLLANKKINIDLSSEIIDINYLRKISIMKEVEIWG